MFKNTTNQYQCVKHVESLCAQGTARKLTLAALFGVCITACSSEEKETPQTLSSTSQATTLTPTALTSAPLTYKIRLPQELSLTTTALSASEHLKIEDGVVLSAEENFGVYSGAQGVEIGADAQLGQQGALVRVLSEGSVFLRERANIQGDLLTSAALTTQEHRTISGTSSENTNIALGKELDWEVSFQDGLPATHIEPQQSTALSPGHHGALTIKPGAHLQLGAGAYYFDSLDAQAHSIIELSNEEEGPTLLYVRAGVTFRGKLQGENIAERLMLVPLTDGTVTIDAPFQGTIFAVNAELHLSPVDGQGHDGAFYARRLEAGANNPLHFVPFAYYGYLFPPKLKAECFNRARADFAAALFSFENPLDESVQLVAPGFNEVTSSIGEPLTVFASGKHQGMYWVQYEGESVEWTLGGHTYVVDETTRHCGRDDWKLVPSEVDFAPPTAYGAEISCTGACAPDLQLVPSPTNILQKPATYLERPWNFELIGEELSEDYDGGGVDFLGGDHHGYMYWTAEQGNFVYIKGGESVDNQVAPSFFSHIEELRPGKTRLWFSFSDKKHSIWHGTRHEVQSIFELDGDTGKVTFVDVLDRNNDSISNRESCKDNNGEGNDCICALSEEGDKWSACLGVHTFREEKPRFCAEWTTQYVDSGFGEHQLNGTNVIHEPASFTLAKLVYPTGEYANWATFYPLDAEGCVPQEFLPAGLSGDLMGRVEMQLMGLVLEESTSTWLRVYEDDVASELTVQVTAQPQDTPLGKYVFRSKALDEMTRSAAVASRAARLQVQGVDMGLTGNDIKIFARSQEAARPRGKATCGSAHVKQADGSLHLRARILQHPTEPKCNDTNSDASLKDVWSHEMGHSVQRLFAGTQAGAAAFPQNWYGLEHFKPDGSKEKLTWPNTPRECECDQTQYGFSPAHCIQSFESINAAQTEGFASAFGKRFYHDGDQSTCTIGYVKWTLWPECPAGTPDPSSQCFRVGDIADPVAFQTEHNILQPINVGSVDANWYLVAPPVVLSCAAATKWRNRQCLDETAHQSLVDFGGNELDWEQFFYGLFSPGVPSAGRVWTPVQVLAGFNDICSRAPDPAACNMDATWEEWQISQLSLSMNGTIKNDHTLRFEQLGGSRGIKDASIDP